MLGSAARSFFFVGMCCFGMLALGACKSKGVDLTSLVVEIRSDLIPVAELEKVQVSIVVNAPLEKEFILGNGEGFSTLPIRFGITPASSSSDTVTIEVVGLKTGVAIVKTGAKAKFVKGSVRFLVIDIDRLCVEVTCGDAVVCRQGQCGLAKQRDNLPEFNAADLGPPAATPNLDGGLPTPPLCEEGLTEACSCGVNPGGMRVCRDRKWSDCEALCGATGLFGSCAVGQRVCDDKQAVWLPCNIAPQPIDGCSKDDDNTCNGVKNEGCACVSGAERPCQEGGLFGKCADGKQVCSPEGVWGACSVAAAAKDTCEPNADENCNGVKNEGCPCTVGAKRPCADGGMFGKCAAGEQVCGGAGAWGTCSVAPSAKDTCAANNDDNCNGTRNEGCVCVAGQTRGCADGGLFGACAVGTQTCSAIGSWGICSALPKAKDTCAPGNDDNCNGVKNDGCQCVQGATRLCSAGGLSGSCAAGTEACAADGHWGLCTLAPKAKDTCAPGNDDNCNGIPNEGCPCVNGQSRKCSAGGLSGKCADGNEVCVAGAWGICSVMPSAKDTCVELNDDNCNGRPNEGCPCFSGQKRTCAMAGAVGRCAAGEQSCSAAGQWSGCSIMPAVADKCTSVDNDDDCNGIKFQGCACVAGAVTCSGRVLQTCSADGKALMQSDCGSAECDDIGKRCFDCAPTARRCTALTAEVCDVNHKWVTDRECNSACDSGACIDCPAGGQRACWKEDTEAFGVGGSQYKSCELQGVHLRWSAPADCSVTCEPNATVCQ